ncbi:GNAT family N-acetyltransferase [Nitratireductor thuwali]|uniref:N-acetyltransferase YsnE n=1 Tax=Nitratireductor thuwali TaxID=2267699 RepID=A0ABY5MIV6_9HYPH|nr:putative N-acetyltransferase YsnE [Nitratireductor thuwali]
MGISIAVETPLQDDVRAMVVELNGHLRPLSPPEFQFQMTAEQMAGADTTVFIARSGAGAALGMGALKTHGEKQGEVKRMWTRPAVRGTGVGRQLLAAVEAQARRTGIARLVLETGGTPPFAPVWRFYEAGGFRRCGVILDYPDTDYSRFYEKLLAQEEAAS